jgi:flagellar biogenesis protein FliO
MKVTSSRVLCLILSCFVVNPAFADSVNSTNAVLMPQTFPEDGFSSMIRVVGALFLVIGVFLGGVWLFRNWQRLNVQRGLAPKLNILEMRSLGTRQAIYVVGYEQERFLVAASPAGVNLLSHLPAAPEGEGSVGNKAAALPSFAEALKQVLKGR